ncbi:MAG: hypothetical protein R6V62_02975 [Candidatus Fermentibacteraceae bacterium]
MKSPDGGGKNPGMQKQPMKPQQKPARPMQEKPAYSPSPKQQYRDAQKPERKPEMKFDRKPERDAGDRKRIAMLDRLKNRQGRSQQNLDADAAESTTTATPGNGRRSCCLGCTVYALAVPLVAVVVSLLI